MAKNKKIFRVGTPNTRLLSILHDLKGELYDRQWDEQLIQHLSLDEISIIKEIEDLLPMNTFISIDYEIKENDEEAIIKDDSELADFITEEEAAITENGARHSDYEKPAGRPFVRADGMEAVVFGAIVEREDEEGIIEELSSVDVTPAPVFYQLVEFHDEDDGICPVGWNFSDSWSFNKLFDQKEERGFEVNVPIEFERRFYLDNDGDVWTNIDEMKRWYSWYEISQDAWKHIKDAAEENLKIRKEREKEKKKSKRRSRKNKEEEK